MPQSGIEDADFLVDESLCDTDLTTNPTAGTVLCTLTPPAGLYKVDTRYFFTGTIGGNEALDNLSLRKAGNEVQRLLTAGTTATNVSECWRGLTHLIRVNGSQTITIVAVANAGNAAAAYHTALIATKVGN